MTPAQKILSAAALFSCYGLVSELDPEWLYWVLGLVATALVAAVELLRARPVNAGDVSELAQKIATLEARMPEDSEARIRLLESYALSPTESRELFSRIAVLESRVDNDQEEDST